MDLPGLIQDYGYLAVLVGSFLEGETVLLLAGYAANRGYLDLPTVIAIAFVGSFLGDQFYFFLGRHWGAQLLARTPAWNARAEKFRSVLNRHHTPLILTLRFIYGFRIVGAVVLGMSGVPPHRFLLLNAAGGVIWAVTVGLAGYGIGGLFSALLRNLPAYEFWIAAAIAVGGFLFWLVRSRAARRKAQRK